MLLTSKCTLTVKDIITDMNKVKVTLNAFGVPLGNIIFIHEKNAINLINTNINL
ncbi:hypothetical protein GCM10008917_09480 [Paraclostridium tenue]|uniref:Ferrous iron transporter FeoA domain-containing protein n=1 Tax=Paraclostridium tenue TaxID=1737 RepID=A0ABN1M0P6_9FIRM